MVILLPFLRCGEGVLVTKGASWSSLFSCLQKAFKRETEVDNWIQKYDHDLGEQQVRNINLWSRLNNVTPFC